MRYGSVCSGIEAATVAWHGLGWRPAFFAEIDPFPCAVLRHHFPETPNLGDFTRIGDEWAGIDLLVGGTPCQSFSVAGLRKGLDDDRGNLALEFLRLAGRLRPRWVVWENVPGVLSSSGGRDLGAFLGGLVDLGYGFAYRVLDAQHFGVPQRRRRVFVVGHLGDWRRAVAVLFERESLSGHPPPGREAGPDVAPSVTPGARRASGARAGEQLTVATTVHARQGSRLDSDCTDTLIPFIVNAAESCARRSHARPSEVARCLDSTGSFANAQGGTVVDIPAVGVRRLTPLECERLQGLPDNFSLVPYRGKPAADGNRYKAIGNSFAVPVIRWIGERIDMVEAI